MSQTDVIANMLRREGKVDNFTCIHNKVSLRLGARINDLRNRGWKIRTEEQDDKNCIYYLESEPTTPPKVDLEFRKEFITQPLFTRAQI